MRDNLRNIIDDGGCLDAATILAYADKKLSASEQHRVERHLSGCELCSAALQGISEMMPYEFFEDDVAELNRNILLKKNNSEKGIIGKPSFLRIAAVLAFFIIASGGLYYFLSSKNENHILTETNLPSPANETIAQPKISESTNTESSRNDIQPEANSPQQKKNSGAVNNETTLSLDEPIKSKAATKDLTADESKYKSDRETFLEKTPASSDSTVTLDENTTTGGTDLTYSTPAAASTEKNKSLLAATSEERKKENVDGLKKANESIESTSTKDDFNHALNLFNSRQYAKAIPYWEKLSLNSSAAQKEDVRWYLANCYFQTKQFEKAKPLLENLSHNSPVYNHPADSILNLMHK